MTDVFISYAHEDHDYVRRFAPALEAEGLSVWWDHTIPPGKTWDEVIAKGIADAECCVVLWSKHSVISDWVKEEATIAKDHQKFIPVQIDNSEPPVGFRRIQAAHLQNWNGNVNDPQWQMLVREIRSVIAAAHASGRAAPARPGYAPRAYQAPPPPQSGGGGPSPLAIGAMVIAGLVALGALGFAMFGGREAPPQEIAATEQVAPQVAPPATAPAPVPAVNPEVERLRAERDAALAAGRAAAAQAEQERQARIRAEAARARQVNLDGRWSYCNSLGYCDTWTLANGTYRTGNGNYGRFTFSGSTFRAESQTSGIIFNGTMSGGVIRGSNTNNVTFELSRQ